MTDPLFSQWHSFAAGARFTDPADLSVRLADFERRVRRRNLVEYVAGAIAIAGFSGGIWIATLLDDWFLAAGWLLGIIGITIVLVNLHSRGSNLPGDLAADCRSHLLAQLERQRNALASVPRWYLAPLVPGLATVLAATARSTALIEGWPGALLEVAPAAVFAIAVFIAVWWLNHHAAGRLSADIAKLESLN